MRARIEAFIQRKLIVNGECWEWPRTQMANRYGCTSIYGKRWLAHRLIYTIFVGEIPAGMMIMHSCDNPPCVRPDHLSVGSAADNARDMVARGRGNLAVLMSVQGTDHPRAKLTEAQVYEIRSLSDQGWQQREIADAYGVSQRNVFAIGHRKLWTHLAEAVA